ncbi:MAG: hypothetical protein Q4C98_07735 [Capnocytophaga sp.]|nr:hypothetical protein [Capnocytophaga sp.]
MKEIYGYFWCFLFVFSAFGQDFDKSLYGKIRRSEALQKRNEPFEKVEQLFNEEISAYEGQKAALAYLHAYKSRFFTLRDSLILAKKEADLSSELALQSNSNEAKAAAYLAQVYINAVVGEEEVVVKNGKEGLNYSVLTDDFFTRVLLNYKLYTIYTERNEVAKMRYYISEALKLAEKSGDFNLMANVYNGVSSTFLSEYEMTEKQSLVDSSWVYLNKSFDLYRVHSEDIANSTISVTCNNIANHFLSYSPLATSEAKQKAFEYLDIVEHLPPDALVLANINGIKSVFALRENDLNLAKSYLWKAQTVLESDPSKNWSTKIQVHRSLAEIAKVQGDFQTANTHLQKINDYQEELFSENQHYNTQKIEVHYEVEKKNQQLAFLEKEVQMRKEQNYLYIGLAIISVIGLIFLFVSYHFRLRYSLEKEKKAQLEKNEAQMQIRLEQEEKQRLKAEQELLEIQRQKLQRAAMATALQVQHKNEVLQEIKEKISQGNTQNIQRIIKEESRIDSDFEELKSQIQALHPRFFQQLRELAVQKLSDLDLKYCAYIYLKMNTRQIAQQFNVEVSSVRMFKYRLKQKFALEKETSLEAFLHGMK